MWNVIDIAKLAKELDSRHPGSRERWLCREFYAPPHAHHDTFLSSTPASLKLIGAWPAAEGIRPPQAVVDQLNAWLDNMQRAHTEEIGGPNDCISIAVGVRDAERLLAVKL